MLLQMAQMATLMVRRSQLPNRNIVVASKFEMLFKFQTLSVH